MKRILILLMAVAGLARGQGGITSSSPPSRLETDYKLNVIAASTANIDLSEIVWNSTAIDGVTITAAGQRFLAKNQSTSSQNGIYVSAASGEAAVRATDSDEWAELPGALVVVGAGGSTNANKVFVNSSASTGTLGSTAISYTDAGSGAASSLQTGVQVVTKSGTSTFFYPAADSSAARGTALTSAVAALADDDTLIVGPGIHAASVTITENRVTIIGTGTLTKLTMTGTGCRVKGVSFGDPSVSTTTIPTGASTGLTDYLCWAQEPTTFENCSFYGSAAANTAGLIIGDGTAFRSTSTGEGASRVISGCKFNNLVAGMVLNTLMEYYTVQGCAVNYCAEGFVCFSGNNIFNGCEAAKCGIGIVLTYPKTTAPVRAYSWGGASLTAPATFADAAAANAYHSRISGGKWNHCTSAIVIEQGLGGSDADVYGVSIHDVEMQANTADLYAVAHEKVLVYDSYSRTLLKADAGATITARNCTLAGMTATGSGAIISAIACVPVVAGYTVNQVTGGVVRFLALANDTVREGITAGSTAFSYTATMPASPSTSVYATNFQITGAGSAAQQANAFNIDFLAGYTGTASTRGIRISNASAGTGTGVVGGSPNIGALAAASGTTTGTNVGVSGTALNGVKNSGLTGVATTAKNSGTNIGVSGFALNTGTSPVQIGGYFGLQNSDPTFASAALMADNGSTTSAIFVARDNGTATFTIADGGAVTATAPLKAGGYTVATLPAGVVGQMTYVTDATAPTYLGALTGGGSVVCPVFYNGTAWVSH